MGPRPRGRGKEEGAGEHDAFQKSSPQAGAAEVRVANYGLAKRSVEQHRESQIGGGQSPFIGLAGAFASFFKTFPYKKIGIKANLENDVFTVNGTIREGGIEYLVKRGSFSGVDIINQNPDNRISFKDMVKRIKRIGSKGGPVVK